MNLNQFSSMDTLLKALHVQPHRIIQRHAFAIANLRINSVWDFAQQGKPDVSNPFSTLCNKSI